MNRNRFVPIIIAVSLVAGIVIGTFLANRFSGNRLNIINTSSNKLNDLLHIIDEQYVDTVQITDLVEKAMPQILSELDPHSSYISAQDATTANDDLKGSFSGIGVQFTIKRDTVYISNVIHGGPSEKTGLLPGDRIISVDEEPYVGEVVTNEETMHRLKGEKGTKVKLGILRHGEKRNFTVTRGDIPVHSIDATYMLTPELGYIRMRNFGDTTYPELLMSLAQLFSRHVVAADSQQRRWLHVASVFSCNFANHLWTLADELLTAQGLPFDALKPLIRTTVDKLDRLTPAESQTGPAVRHDTQVIDSHLSLLDGDKREIYRLLTDSIMDHHPTKD